METKDMTKLVPILGVIAVLASPLAASAQNVGHIASAKRGPTARDVICSRLISPEWKFRVAAMPVRGCARPI